MTPSAARYPLWSWTDAGIFFALGLPCILVAGVSVSLIGRIFHAPPADPILLIAGQTIGYGLLFALLATILRMQYDAPFWRTLGWVDSGLSTITCIAMGVMLAFGLALLGGLLRLPNVDSTMSQMLKSQRSAVIVAIFGVFIAPVAEELAFRGFLQPLFVRSLGAMGGIVLTAIPFGLLHLAQNAWSWSHVALIATAGATFGAIRHLTGSTQASILAHAGYNATLFAAFFAVGRNSGF